MVSAFGESLNYLNLVNSHFTWMTEGGWLVSVLYLFGWMAVLIFCWPISGARLRALPLALWVAFGVAAFFSHLEESPWLWVLPVLALVVAIGERWRKRQWPSGRSFAASGVMAVALVTGLVLIGLATRSLPLSLSGQMVTVGTGSGPDGDSGGPPGHGVPLWHTFRRFLAHHPGELDRTTFLLSEASDHLPALSPASWVVSGKLTQAGVLPQLPPGSSVILLNPSALPEDAGLEKNLAGSTRVYFGEYSQLPSRSSWAAFPGIQVLEIEGASDFVPTWPQAILAPPKT